MAHLLLALYFGAGALLLLVRSLLRSRSRKAPYPPGPKPLPLVGNVFDVPTKHLGQEFRELSRTYGDVLRLNLLGQDLIILGSYEAAMDVLEKRAVNFANRQPSVMAALTGWDWAFVLWDGDARWRRHRRAFHKYFEPGAIDQYEPIQLREAHRMLRNLLHEPDKLMEHIELCFGATILRIVYGIEVETKRNPYFDAAEKAALIFIEAFTPGRYLVEIFPALRYLPSWFPGGGFKTLAAKWKKDVLAMRNAPFEAAEHEEKTGSAKPSVVTRMLSSIGQLTGKEAAEEREVCKNVAGLTYIAGADTTHLAVQAFFLAMVTFPDVQKRAQAQLDAVLGEDRLPAFSDRSALPYIDAIILEVARWHVLPLGFPHKAAADDIYNGLCIPAGALVSANVWSISRDPEAYPDPDRFYPERFLKDGAINREVRDPRTYAFGFGRRICPGRHFAEASMFILFASVLQAFDIGPPTDKDGVLLPLDVKLTTNQVTSRIEGLRCTIKPRSARLQSMVADTSQL